MKRLVGILAALLLMVSSWGIAPAARASESELVIAQPSVLLALTNAADAKPQELINKLDLNNSRVREFRRLRGFYPGLASKIIQNAPYDEVEDVLEIPGLSDSQLERLQANLDEFFVSEMDPVMNAGGDRYNPGVY